MEIGVEVGAAVLDDGEAEIVVGGFEQSGEDNAAGRNAEEDKRVNIVGAENHSQVSSREALTRCLVTTISPSLGASAAGITPSRPSNSF